LPESTKRGPVWIKWRALSRDGSGLPHAGGDLTTTSSSVGLVDDLTTTSSSFGLVDDFELVAAAVEINELQFH